MTTHSDWNVIAICIILSFNSVMILIILNMITKNNLIASERRSLLIGIMYLTIRCCIFGTRGLAMILHNAITRHVSVSTWCNYTIGIEVQLWLINNCLEQSCVGFIAYTLASILGKSKTLGSFFIAAPILNLIYQTFDIVSNVTKGIMGNGYNATEENYCENTVEIESFLFECIPSIMIKSVAISYIVCKIKGIQWSKYLFVIPFIWCLIPFITSILFYVFRNEIIELMDELKFPLIVLLVCLSLVSSPSINYHYYYYHLLQTTKHIICSNSTNLVGIHLTQRRGMQELNNINNHQTQQ